MIKRASAIPHNLRVPRPEGPLGLGLMLKEQLRIEESVQIFLDDDQIEAGSVQLAFLTRNHPLVPSC